MQPVLEEVDEEDFTLMTPKKKTGNFGLQTLRNTLVEDSRMEHHVILANTPVFIKKDYF